MSCVTKTFQHKIDKRNQTYIYIDISYYMEQMRPTTHQDGKHKSQVNGLFIYNSRSIVYFWMKKKFETDLPKYRQKIITKSVSNVQSGSLSVS